MYPALRAFGRYLRSVVRRGVPKVKPWVSVLGAALALAGLPVGAGLLSQSVIGALITFGALVLGVVLPYGAWKDADDYASSYERSSELQKGFAEHIRAHRELRGRIAAAAERHLPELHGDVAATTWYVKQDLAELWLAWELQAEWLEEIPGASAGDQEAFRTAIGGFSRDGMLAHLDRRIELLVRWQERLV